MTIFGLKVMVKSGLEKIILKFHVPLQRYLLTSQANSAFLGRFFLHWAVASFRQIELAMQRATLVLYEDI